MNKNLVTAILGIAMVFCVAKLQAETVTWDGAGDTTWSNPDAADFGAGTYDDGDTAVFTDTGAGTVTMSSGLAPGATIVSNTVDYTFSGDSLAGTGKLHKALSGQLTLSGVNTFSGGIQLSGGDISFDDTDDDTTVKALFAFNVINFDISANSVHSQRTFFRNLDNQFRRNTMRIVTPRFDLDNYLVSIAFKHKLLNIPTKFTSDLDFVARPTIDLDRSGSIRYMNPAIRGSVHRFVDVLCECR